MTREELLAQADLTILNVLKINVDDIPNRILFNMAKPWNELSNKEQDEIYTILRSTGKVIN